LEKKRSIVLSIYVLILIIFILFFNSYSSLGVPVGGNLTFINSSRGYVANPNSLEAQAGNVTEFNIYGVSITQAWQGYFGNVTGLITLGDVNNKTLYNWSVSNPVGEVYAARGIVTWSNIQCFNFTARGTYEDYAADASRRGNYNLYGKNLSLLEAEYNISTNDSDGVDETFTLIGAGTHDAFSSASIDFTEGLCRNTRLYGSTGAGVNDQFEEVLLWDPDRNNTVFASILDNDLIGFDLKQHDFEMLVLEDGHRDNTGITNYYFYVEIG
jgi:hypothetical protein